MSAFACVSGALPTTTIRGSAVPRATHLLPGLRSVALVLVAAGRVTASDAALAATQRALAAGAVVAIKGIGGYHLACIVDDDKAVRALRTRKARGGKPSP